MARFTALALTLFVLVLTLLPPTYAQQGTEFTYQGLLQNSLAPANGNFDFEFLLFDALSDGTQVGSTLSRNNVAVANGNFSVKLDFGANFPGANRFLEIHVRQTGVGGFTTLSPRQAISSAPYSIKSISADTAVTATTATSAITANTATNFTGSLAGDVTGTQGNTSVGKLRGITLDTAVPTDGQVLRYDGPGSKWSPATISTGGTTPANYVFSYTLNSQACGNAAFSDVIFTDNPQINGWLHPPSTASFTAGQTGLYLISYTAKLGPSRSQGPNEVAVRAVLNNSEIAGSQNATTILRSDQGPMGGFPVTTSFIANISSGDVIKIQCISLIGGGIVSGIGDGPLRTAASVTITRIQ